MALLGCVSQEVDAAEKAVEQARTDFKLLALAQAAPQCTFQVLPDKSDSLFFH